MSIDFPSRITVVMAEVPSFQIMASAKTGPFVVNTIFSECMKLML